MYFHQTVMRKLEVCIRAERGWREEKNQEEVRPALREVGGRRKSRKKYGGYLAAVSFRRMRALALMKISEIPPDM